MTGRVRIKALIRTHMHWDLTCHVQLGRHGDNRGSDDHIWAFHHTSLRFGPTKGLHWNKKEPQAP